MLFAILFGAILNTSVQGHLSYDECQAQNFKPKACFNSEQFYKVGSFACKIQGKKFIGKAPGNNNGCEK